MSTTGRIALVRHGECVYDACGRSPGLIYSALTDRGRAQASRCAEVLSDLGFRGALLLSSPLDRALHTARAIGEFLGVPVAVRWELIERHLGAWTAARRGDAGPTSHELPPPLPSAHPLSGQIGHGLHQFLGWAGRDGEAAEDVAVRVSGVWADAVAHAGQGRDVVLVSHDWPLQALLRSVAGPSGPVVPTPTGPVLVHPAAGKAASVEERNER